MKGTVTTYIPGELESLASDGVIASSEAIFDYSQDKSQEEINGDIERRVGEIEADVVRLYEEVNAPKVYEGDSTTIIGNPGINKVTFSTALKIAKTSTNVTDTYSLVDANGGSILNSSDIVIDKVEPIDDTDIITLFNDF